MHSPDHCDPMERREKRERNRQRELAHCRAAIGRLDLRIAFVEIMRAAGWPYEAGYMGRLHDEREIWTAYMREVGQPSGQTE